MYFNVMLFSLLSPSAHHLVAARAPPTPKADPAPQQRKGAEEQRDWSDYTRSFIDYSIYFRSFDRIVLSDDVCMKESHGKLRYNTSSKVLDEIYDSYGETEDRCANPGYWPRWVDSTQVTWRHVQHEDRDDHDSDRAPPPRRPDSHETVNGAERRSQRHKSHDGDTAHSRRSSSTASAVHPLFAIALLLPNHPPSADMFAAVRALAPMFPSVQFVVGDAVEFQDLPLFSEFPQLLMFSGGTMSGRSAGRPSTLAELGAVVAAWAREPPRAVPIYYLAPEFSSQMARALVYHQSIGQNGIPCASYILQLLRWFGGRPFISCANHFGCAPPVALQRFEALAPLHSGTAWSLWRSRSGTSPPVLASSSSWPLEPLLPWTLAADNKLQQLLNLSLSLPVLLILHAIAIGYSLIRVSVYVNKMM
jgi:hypothetical protein